MLRLLHEEGEQVMTKIGNLEIPDGIQLILSFPGRTQEEINEFKLALKNAQGATTIFTSAVIKVLAKNQHVVVLELDMK